MRADLQKVPPIRGVWLAKNGESTKIRMLYEIINEEIKVAPFSWIVGFVAIFVTGVVILRRRKK